MEDNIFNVPISTDEDIKKMVGTTINCIDLTPFTALSGTLIGYIKISDDEDFKDEVIKNMILAVDKNYESTEELKDFIIEWKDLIGITTEELENILNLMEDNVPIEVDEDNIYLDFIITRELMDTKKVIVVPFTHCSSEAF